MFVQKGAPLLGAAALALSACGGGTSSTVSDPNDPAGFGGSGLISSGAYTGPRDAATLGASVDAENASGALPATRTAILLPGTTGSITVTGANTLDVTALGETITLSNATTGDPAIYASGNGSVALYVGPNQTHSAATVFSIIDPATDALSIAVAPVGSLAGTLPSTSTAYTVDTIFQILRGDGAFDTLTGTGDTLTVDFSTPGTPISGTLTLTDTGRAGLPTAAGGPDGTVTLTVTDSLVSGTRFAVELTLAETGELLAPEFNQVEGLGGFFGPTAEELVAGVSDTGTLAGSGDGVVLLGSIQGAR